MRSPGSAMVTQPGSVQAANNPAKTIAEKSGFTNFLKDMNAPVKIISQQKQKVPYANDFR